MTLTETLVPAFAKIIATEGEPAKAATMIMALTLADKIIMSEMILDNFNKEDFAIRMVGLIFTLKEELSTLENGDFFAAEISLALKTRLSKDETTNSNPG